MLISKLSGETRIVTKAGLPLTTLVKTLTGLHFTKVVIVLKLLIVQEAGFLSNDCFRSMSSNSCSFLVNFHGR